MSSYIAKDVRCPYYKKDDGVKICCEGVEDSDSSLHIVFPSTGKRIEYQREKCCRDYNLCLIAAMNNRKYMEDEE